MSANEQSNGRGSVGVEGQSVLSNLPRSRPQRSSPRRAAARKTTSETAATSSAPLSVNGSSATAAAPTRVQTSAKKKPADAVASKQKASTQRKPKVAKATAKRKADTEVSKLHAAEEVPQQGFECEGERVRGPVAPPGGAELVASVAEIFSEFAKAGVSAGERLLKDALARLPLS